VESAEIFGRKPDEAVLLLYRTWSLSQFRQLGTPAVRVVAISRNDCRAVRDFWSESETERLDYQRVTCLTSITTCFQLFRSFRT